MRNFLYLFLAVGLFVITGCGDDDAAVSVMESDIVGTWNVTDYNSDLDVSGNFFGIDFTENATSSISNSSLQITFDANNTWSSAGDYDITIATSDTTETYTESGIGNGTWQLMGSTLNLTGVDAGDEAAFDDIDFTITGFSAGSSLDMNADIDETETDPIFMSTFTSEGNIEMKLRQ